MNSKKQDLTKVDIKNYPNLVNYKIGLVVSEWNIDITKNYTAVIKTSLGDMSVEFFTEDAPMTVNNFINLSRDGYYAVSYTHLTLPTKA